MRTHIPLVANTPEPEDWRCVLACIRMVLQAYTPEHDKEWSELDTIARHEAGKGTWFAPLLKYLSDAGYTIRAIENFNYQRAATEKDAYLKEIYPDTWEWYRDNTNFLKVVDTFPWLGEHTQLREATREDLENALKSGETCMLEVNHYALYEEKGFAPHAVLAYAFDADGVWIQDPGLPAKAEQHIPWGTFMQAWQPRSITAISI